MSNHIIDISYVCYGIQLKRDLLWLNIKTEEMRSFLCQLHWGSFAGHCFRCGGLGHFMAECQQTSVVEVTNTSHGDELIPEYITNDNGVPKTEANVGKGKGVAIVEHKDRYIQERRKDLIDEDGSWIKVSSKVNHPRYEREEVHEHHIMGKNGIVEKQNWKRNSSRRTIISIYKHQPSMQNAFAVLSDYLGIFPRYWHNGTVNRPTSILITE